jgi:hypothetical protein
LQVKVLVRLEQVQDSTLNIVREIVSHFVLLLLLGFSYV